MFRVYKFSHYKITKICPFFQIFLLFIVLIRVNVFFLMQYFNAVLVIKKAKKANVTPYLLGDIRFFSYFQFGSQPFIICMAAHRLSVSLFSSCMPYWLPFCSSIGMSSS